VFWFFFWKLFFFVLLSLLSLIHGGRGWTLVEAWGASSSILMWIHLILGLPIQQHRFSRMGSSLPVGFFWGRCAGLGTWSVPRSDEVVLELHLVAVGSNHGASIQLMSMLLIQPAFVMSLSEIRNHGVAEMWPVPQLSPDQLS
jgi:hypothetical protein